ncbi:MAG TPA: DUF2147 domain-containing protein [Tenuifilaceae bacterium]|nr:DUF2147 domain-containing protein [Tenuifilaceae bacterium]HPE17461.1 DUF2147 domain-containing protein [Tenuifilaceae bacterium]HPJ45590.1 DUF2147 domain-containing protein [Tenuifilaceae bacterium]HPQ33460.1 DUF2147 domain-containing protein [Tenuifilaceae bacterium]HRX67007.1 DUF2147 domain-containing protein [Tenuifilaceae bacterium]
MKKLFFISILVLVGTALFAQNADKVIGVWLTQDGDSKVTITKDSKGKFNGEITWLKTPVNEDGTPKIDDKNPEKKLQTRPIMGLKLLSGFVYDDDDNEWVDGEIYDPKSGKTYSCLMWFEDDPNTLSVKGFIGFSLIGKEVAWTRSN